MEARVAAVVPPRAWALVLNDSGVARLDRAARRVYFPLGGDGVVTLACEVIQQHPEAFLVMDCADASAWVAPGQLHQFVFSQPNSVEVAL